VGAGFLYPSAPGSSGGGLDAATDAAMAQAQPPGAGTGVGDAPTPLPKPKPPASAGITAGLGESALDLGRKALDVVGYQKNRLDEATLRFMEKNEGLAPGSLDGQSPSRRVSEFLLPPENDPPGIEGGVRKAARGAFRLGYDAGTDPLTYETAGAGLVARGGRAATEGLGFAIKDIKDMAESVGGVENLSPEVQAAIRTSKAGRMAGVVETAANKSAAAAQVTQAAPELLSALDPTASPDERIGRAVEGGLGIAMGGKDLGEGILPKRPIPSQFFEPPLGNRPPAPWGFSQWAKPHDLNPTELAEATEAGAFPNIIPDRSLHAGDRVASDVFEKKIEDSPDNLVGEYRKRFGNVVSRDDARELSDDYSASNEARGVYAGATRQGASFVAGKVYDKLLSEAPDADHDASVLFTAGGTGAGKSTALKALGADGSQAARAQVVVDSNMADYASSKVKFDKALQAGKSINYVFTLADPVASFPRVLARAEDTRPGGGRMVGLDSHIRSYTGSADTALALFNEYGQNPNVQFHWIDNTGLPGQAHPFDPSQLAALKYNPEALHGQLVGMLRKAFDDGSIGPATFLGAHVGPLPDVRSFKPDAAGSATLGGEDGGSVARGGPSDLATVRSPEPGADRIRTPDGVEQPIDARPAQGGDAPPAGEVPLPAREEPLQGQPPVPDQPERGAPAPGEGAHAPAERVAEQADRAQDAERSGPAAPGVEAAESGGVGQDPAVAAKVAEINARYDDRVSSAGKYTGDKASELKRLAMQRAAEIRQATGNLTPIEKANAEKAAATLSAGRPVQLATGERGVVERAPVFGKVKVTLEDGSSRTVDAADARVLPPGEKPAVPELPATAETEAAAESPSGAQSQEPATEMRAPNPADRSRPIKPIPPGTVPGETPTPREETPPPPPSSETPPPKTPPDIPPGAPDSDRLANIIQPRVEGRVADLEHAADTQPGAADNLARDTPRHWTELDPEVARVKSQYSDDDFIKTAQERRLSDTEVMAADSRLNDLFDGVAQSHDALKDNPGDRGLMETYLKKMTNYVALQRAQVNDATSSARALAAQGRIMRAGCE
jgi:hypothetical protein